MWPQRMPHWSNRQRAIWLQQATHSVSIFFKVSLHGPGQLVPHPSFQHLVLKFNCGGLELSTCRSLEAPSRRDPSWLLPKHQQQERTWWCRHQLLSPGQAPSPSKRQQMLQLNPERWLHPRISPSHQTKADPKTNPLKHLTVQPNPLPMPSMQPLC